MTFIPPVVDDRDPRINPDRGDQLLVGFDVLVVEFIGKNVNYVIETNRKGRKSWEISLASWQKKTKDAHLLRIGPAEKHGARTWDEKVAFNRARREYIYSIKYPEKHHV